MVTVKRITTKRDLKKFVDFPLTLYRDVKAFVPPIYGDELDDWNPAKNPASEYCDWECFLAYKDGKLVGRIGAILSHAANQKWNTARMRFTHVDFIDDYEVSEALFFAVEEYAKENGCTEVHGPLGWTDMDREGMLLEGYDKRSMFITFYNFPYYHDHLERLGYVKDTDWIEYKITIPNEESEIYQRICRLSEYAKKRYNLRLVAPKCRKDFYPHLKALFALANEAYSQLYGMVPTSIAQQERCAKSFVPLMNPDYVCFVYNELDELVGFGVCAPSLADAFKKCNGKLFPFGFAGVLKALKKNDALDMFLIASRPDMQQKGVNSVVIEHIFKSCIKNGIKYAETGPMLETNHKIHSQWRGFPLDLHKRRRCYIKGLELVQNEEAAPQELVTE